MPNDPRRTPEQHLLRMRDEIANLVEGELVGIVTDAPELPPERFKDVQVGPFLRYDEANETLYLAAPTWREINQGPASLKEYAAFPVTSIREIRRYKIASTTLTEGYFDDRK